MKKQAGAELGYLAMSFFEQIPGEWWLAGKDLIIILPQLKTELGDIPETP